MKPMTLLCYVLIAAAYAVLFIAYATLGVIHFRGH